MNPRLKRFVTIFATLLVVAGIVLTATGAAQAQDKKLKIILVAHGAGGNPFWVVVMKGAADAAKIFDVDQQWIGKDVADTVAALPQSLDEAIAAKPDGLGITGVNAEGTREGLTTLAKNGVPIIIFNTDDPNANDPDKRLPYLFYIGTSEFISGQSNAKAALKAAKDAGVKITNAVCPIQEVGHPALEARCAGYSDVMKQAGVKVDSLTISNDPSASAGVLTDYFKGHPTTTAINTLGPSPASAYYIYAKDAAVKPGAIFHTTHDTSTQIFENIQSGITFQAVDQQPYYQGFGTVEWLWLNLKYKLVPGGNILTGPSYIDKSNVARISELVKTGYR